MQKYNEIIEKAKGYISVNLETGVVVEEIAQHVGYSTKQLNRIFLITMGITVSEYLRYIKFVKAVYEIKYSKTPIVDISLKYGYESQEGFTRTFKNFFGVTPGEYRISEKTIEVKNWHVNNMLHIESHEAVGKGLYCKQPVDCYIAHHPPRIWASARRNHENLSPNEFYGLCGREGVMDKTGTLPNVLIEGGAILTMDHGNNQLCFGVEVDADYPSELLKDYEVFHIPEMQYIVFNCTPYAKEAHGGVIESIWSAQREFNLAQHGLDWNYGEAPIIESDDKDSGYTMWFPVKEVK